MNVTTGPGFVRANRTRHCQVHLQLNKLLDGAGSWQCGLNSMTRQGRATLDEGVTASIFTSYVFSNVDTGYSNAETRYPAAGTKVVVAEEKIFEEAHNFQDIGATSGCWASSMLNINTRSALSVSDDLIAGSLSLDRGKQGQRLVQTLGLDWGECKW